VTEREIEMKNVRFFQAFVDFVARASVLFAGSFGMAALLAAGGSSAQDVTAQKDNNAPAKSYDVHESYDVGGHIANINGSGAMYDTLVNLRSGPRVLNSTFEAHAVPGVKHTAFDTLFEGSSGYGGDPNDVTTLRMSKGKVYDFSGMFRRDRQYFDYDPFGNPLVPAGLVSNGYTFPQVEDAPHLFNTVRRMLDLNLTMLPLSKVGVRAGYSKNTNEGPSYSSIHVGADALLNQYWRNATETWLAAVDWRPVRGTTFTYEEHINHYKGDTTWSLAGANLVLPTGQPVSLGFDNLTVVGAVSATTGCNAAAGKPAILGAEPGGIIANPCVNGYVKYTRSAPTRTLFPTEEFRFQSSTLKNIQMTGRALYTGASMKMPGYNEYFNGLESRVTTTVVKAPPGPAPSAWCAKATAGGVTTYSDCANIIIITGSGKAQRINVAADYGVVWQIARVFSLSDQFDFEDFRQPAILTSPEIDQYSSGMGAAPAVTVPVTPTLAPANFLGQKMESNRITGEWEAAAWIQVSLGYGYRTRTLTVARSLPTEAVTAANLLNYAQQINENSGLFGLVMRPTRTWRINATVENTWADAAYVQTDPRQSQHYQVRTTYKAKGWATFTGAFNDFERRDNVTLVNYLAHSRAASGGATLNAGEHVDVDLSYGYIDVFSRSTNCFFDPVGSQPADAVPMPGGATAPACGNVNVYSATTGTVSSPGFYGTSYFDAPTHYGSASIVLMPIKPIEAVAGYRVTATGGRTEQLNPAEVPGTLQSKYQMPYGSLSWKVMRAWAFKGDWNYYGYGETSGLVGPMAPRNFHGNICTLGVHYEY
jgi:hypothetical protein